MSELRAEVERLRAALPTCDRHKPNGGARSGCVICAGMELSAALARIDYLCGPPNEMELSAYDVHQNPDGVIAAVERLRARIAELETLCTRMTTAWKEGIVMSGDGKSGYYNVLGDMIAAMKEGK